MKISYFPTLSIFRPYRSTVIIMTFSLFLLVQNLAAETQKPLLLNEIKTWTYFKEPSIFSSCGKVMTYCGEDKIPTLFIYSVETKEEMTLPLPKGDGPGEVAYMKGVIIHKQCFHIWDSRLRRLSRFAESNGHFIDVQRVPSQFILSQILSMNHDSPIFSVSRSHNNKGKKEYWQTIEGLPNSPFPIIPAQFEPDKISRYELPLMLTSGTQTHIAAAVNTTYRITIMPIMGTKPVIIESRAKPVPWSADIQSLFHRFLTEETKAEFDSNPKPGFIQALHAISLSENRLAVCLNTIIDKDKALIDVYHLSGEKIGAFACPSIPAQFYSPIPFHFSRGFILVDDHHLAALHYDHDEEQFVVALYRLPI